MPHSRRSIRWPRLSPGHLFVLPALAIVGFFVLVPIARTIRFSLLDDFSYPDPEFIGLANYRRLFADPDYWRALWHTLFLAGGSLVLQMPAALGLAALVTRRFRGRSLVRAGFFLPVLMPTSAVALIWVFMIDNPNVVNDALGATGLEALRYPWLAGPVDGGTLRAEWTAMASLLVVVSWKYVGFHMMLFVAGIESIPEEIYEAARLDGAGAWRTFRHVTLPLLRRVLIISIALSVIGSLKYFDIVWVMTGGDGPFSHATDLMATYMYRTAYGSSARLHLAAAAAVTILAVCLVGFGLTRLLRREVRP